METRRLVIGMLLAMAVVFGWQLFVGYLYEKNPQWRRPGQEPPQMVTTAPAEAPPAATTEAAVESPRPTTATLATGPTNLSLAQTAPQATIQQLGIGDEKIFPLQLTLSSSGAGIELATLKRFKASDGVDVYTFQSPYPNAPESRPLATRFVSVDGQTIDLTQANWNLQSTTDRSATYVLDIMRDQRPVVRLRKTFTLGDSSTPGAGYEVALRHSFENLSDRPVVIRSGFNGPTLPPQEVERGPDQQIIAGYDNDREVRANSAMVEEFGPENPVRDFLRSDKGLPMLWAGAASIYFQGIVRPEPLAANAVVPEFLSKVQAQALDPSASTYNRNILLTFETDDRTLAPNQSLELAWHVFLGPKQRSLLNNDRYGTFPLSYDTTLVIANNWCGICTFQWLINILVAMLSGFHWLFGGFAGARYGDWGLAIIALVCVVRILLHPITKKSQVSMMKMGKMGPEIQRLKEKYGDDRDALNREMMAVYKEQGFTPILGCLPMFLQMPIWIALWSALNSTFELRQAPFLWGYTWIDDLAKPDLLIDFGRSIPLVFGMTLSGINLLPLLLAVVFYLQQKMMPKPPATTKEQEQQQKMMQWMSLLFPIFLYNGPSGLNLYILTSTTIGIIESKRIRDHIKQKEEEEKARREPSGREKQAGSVQPRPERLLHGAPASERHHAPRGRSDARSSARRRPRHC